MGIKIGGILFFIVFLIVGIRSVSTLQCPPDIFSFQIQSFSKADPSFCSIYWSIGYSFSNHTQYLLAHDKYLHHLPHEQEQFDYCVRKERLFIDFDFSEKCFQQGYMEIRFQGIFIEAIPFESHLIHVVYHLDQSISFTHSLVDWQVENVLYLHSYLIHSSTTGCIRFASREICLTEKEEYFLPPTHQTAIHIENQNQLPLFILPLYYHPQHHLSYRSFQLPIEYKMENQTCHVSFSFPHRKEWVNGLFLNSSWTHSSTVYVYTNENDKNQFIDASHVAVNSFIRFGYFRQTPFSNIHFLFTSVNSCDELANSIQLISYPLLRLYPGIYPYCNQESVRIQLPCSLVYSYKITATNANSRQIKELPLLIRPSGLLISKRAGFQIIQVLGQYLIQQPLLTEYAIQPEEVTVPITIHYTKCSSLVFYRVLVELTTESVLFSRFFVIDDGRLLSYMEVHPHGRIVSRSFCCYSPNFKFVNEDGVEGSITVFSGDFSIYSAEFTSEQYAIPVHLIIPLLNYVERKDKESSWIICDLYRVLNKNYFINLFIIAPSLKSVTIDKQVIFNKTSSTYTSAFLRLLLPIPSISDKMYIEYASHQSRKNDRFYYTFYDRFEYNSHIINISLYNTTMLINPLHHEHFCINTIYFHSVTTIPSFSMFLLSNSHWIEIGGFSGDREIYPISTLLQVPNEDSSLQYRIEFDTPPDQFPEISFGYEKAGIWRNHDYLTPGFHFVVYKDCYNWISFGRKVHVAPTSALLLQYQLYFDWNNEILFGTANASIILQKMTVLEEDMWERLNDQINSVGKSDSILISSHIQLSECPSSSIKMFFSTSTVFENLLIKNDHDEVTSFIPSSFKLSSITLCLPRDTVFYVSSTKPCLIQVHSLDYSIHSILPVSIQPMRFSTFFSSLSSLEIASSSSSLQWKSLPLSEEQQLITSVPSFLFFRITVKQPSTLLHIEVNPARGVFVMVQLKEQKIVLDNEESTLDIVVDSDSLIVKLRCLQLITNQQLQSLLKITMKEQVSIQEIPFTSSLTEDSFYNLFHYLTYHWKFPIQQNLHIQYDYHALLPLSSISFSYHYSHTSSILFHIYLSYSNSSTVLHNTILEINASVYWNSFSLSLPSSILFSSISFSFELLVFSSPSSILLELRDLEFNSLSIQPSQSNQEVYIKEQPKPLLEKLQAIAKEKEPLKKKEKKKAVYCKEEKDSVYSLVWKWTSAVTHVRQACPYGSGTLHRFCDSQGNWSGIDGKCKKVIQPELLQQAFTRGSSVSSSPPSPPSIPKPVVQFCEEDTIDNITFPATLLNRTISVPCKHPLLGILYRTCNMNGTWSNLIGKCSNCPVNSFAYFNRTTETTQCIECPSGSAFIRGNPLNPIKCYGSYYSEGGKTECSLCKGTTRGNERTGNFACKECMNGVIVGTRCMNTTSCQYQGKRIPVGQLVYQPCDNNYRGYRTQVCKYHSFSSSKLGVENIEGCYNPIPSLGHFLMEISFVLQNFHYSSLLHRYDQNKYLNQTKPIQLIQQILQHQLSSIITTTIQFVNYYDLSTPTSVATRIHVTIEGEYLNQTDRIIFSHLKQKLPDVTMQLKEKCPILFHYYVILKDIELVWSSSNPSFCQAEGDWPTTPIGETAKRICDNPFSIGYQKRVCVKENNHAVWSSVDTSLCEIQRKDFNYIYRVVYARENTREKRVQTFYEQLLDQMNCDHIADMTFIRFNSSVLLNSTLFRHVFKDCRIEQNRFIITFSSTTGPYLDFIHFLFGFSLVEFVTVIQEGLISRSSYVLQFTTRKIRDCPSSYLYCNLQHVVPGYVYLVSSPLIGLFVTIGNVHYQL